MLIRYGQEAAAVIESSEFIDQREALQSCLGTFTFGNILNLENKMRRMVVRVTHQRNAVQRPHNLTETMYVALLDMAGRRFTLQQTVKVREVMTEVVSVSDGLE